MVLNGPYLSSANLGDSGFMVIRGDKVLYPIFISFTQKSKIMQNIGRYWRERYRTKEQQHRFNFPFQLGNTSRDKPHHANFDKIPVQSGDIVILGTVRTLPLHQHQHLHQHQRKNFCRRLANFTLGWLVWQPIWFSNHELRDATKECPAQTAIGLGSQARPRERWAQDRWFSLL